MASPVENVLETISSHGVLGAICVILMVWIYRKDKELSDERAARLSDVKTLNEAALKLQRETLGAVDKMKDIFDALKSKGTYR